MTQQYDFDKTCFFVSPIGAEGSGERDLSDRVLKHLLRPAIKPLEIEYVIRADDLTKTGNITQQVIEAVVKSKLVVADLTGHNPNVFYELAVRHASHKPCSLIVSQADYAARRLPFDIAAERVFMYRDAIGDNGKVVEQLRALIEADLSGHAENPIVTYQRLEQLKEGGNTEGVVLREILDRLQAVEARTTSRMLPPMQREGFYAGSNPVVTVLPYPPEGSMTVAEALGLDTGEGWTTVATTNNVAGTTQFDGSAGLTISQPRKKPTAKKPDDDRA